MERQINHTPVPYHMDIEPDTGRFKVFTVQEGHYILIADGLIQANAELIVRDHNSRYELLAFAEQVLTDIALGKLFMKRPEQLVTGILYSHERTMDLHEKAKAVIAKAEGK